MTPFLAPSELYKTKSRCRKDGRMVGPKTELEFLALSALTMLMKMRMKKKMKMIRIMKMMMMKIMLFFKKSFFSIFLDKNLFFDWSSINPDVSSLTALELFGCRQSVFYTLKVQL